MIDRGRAGRSFVYRGGVRLAGTVVACDAATGSALVFLSHAPALGARGRRALPHLGSGSRQILATDVTLALLGPAGERMRRHALVADRIVLRGHRSIVQAAAAYRDAGLPAPPVARFDRRLGAGEVLLWPAGERLPGQRAGGRTPGVVLIG